MPGPSTGIKKVAFEEFKAAATPVFRDSRTDEANNSNDVEFTKLFNIKNRNQLLNSLVDLDGIGQTQIESIDNFFLSSTNVIIIRELINKLDITNYINKSNNGKFSNKKMMFTGGFQKMSRSEAKAVAESNGGKVVSSISKKLDFLVVGETKPTIKKVNQAKIFKIKILSEKDWNKILNS